VALNLSSLPLFDTHDHLVPESERVGVLGDVFEILFRHYASTDLLSAGLALSDLEFIRDAGHPLPSRWQRMAPVWSWTRHTAYAQPLRIALRDLYGVSELSAGTLDRLAAQMQAEAVPGFYAQVVARAGIRIAVIVDNDETTTLPLPPTPPGLTRLVLKGDPLVLPRSRRDLDRVAAEVKHVPEHSLDDWLDGCAQAFNCAGEAVALKLHHAYERSLDTGKPAHHEAEQVFKCITNERGHLGFDESLNWREAQPLHDYLLHHVIRLPIEHRLPVQMHTGALEGTYQDVRRAHPQHMTPLLLEYRTAKFALFHGGYPWLREFALLGKTFPNVWLDLCWVWSIAPVADRALLHELIEVVPANKVLAFGADYGFIEGTYGAAQVARANVTRVLEEKVAEGWFSAADAEAYARSAARQRSRTV
jgi:hypothetical protein